MKTALKIFLSISLLSFFSFTQTLNDIKPAVGEMAPEISMAGINGQTLKLSSLRGKIVLVDFWASWCRTCRIENNTYTQAYSKYKNRQFKDGDGFEIFSVSLDTDPTIWKKAIINDRMTWANHVSDFKKWDSQIVTTYNFKYLPHNLLIDKNGKILAKGLFGKNLEDFLVTRLAD